MQMVVMFDHSTIRVPKPVHQHSFWNAAIRTLEIGM